MLREYLRSAAVDMPLFAFALFFSVFVMVLVRAWRRPPQADDTLAALPFEDGTAPGKEMSRE